MNHPDRKVLLAYLRATDNEFNSVEEHVENCPKCLESLERISAFEMSTIVAERQDDVSDEPDTNSLQTKDLRYEFHQLIGRGGMAVVYRCHDKLLERDVALKVIRRKLASNPEALQRFTLESQICAGLQHHGTATVHDRGFLVDGRPFFAMRLVVGKTFKQLLDERSHGDTASLLRMFQHVCQTVAYAHQSGVVHRDLKPSNILVGEFGEVQVMDWGIAERNQEAIQPIAMTASGEMDETVLTVTPHSCEPSILGTPNYMSPEQAGCGADSLNPRVDVFSLGVILFEIISAQPLYPSGTMFSDVQRRTEIVANSRKRLLNCSADEELVQLVESCLAVDVEKRPSHAGEVASRMADFFASQEKRLKQAELVKARAEAEAAHERKRRKLALALAFAMIALAVISTIFLAAHFKQRQALNIQYSARLVPAVEKANWLMQLNSDFSSLDRNTLSQVRSLVQEAEGIASESPDDQLKQDYFRMRDQFTGFEQRAVEVLEFEDHVNQFFQSIELANEIQDARLIHNRGTIRNHDRAPVRIYDAAFKAIGITSESELDSALEILRRFRATRRQELVLALHQWALLKWYLRDNPQKQIELAVSFDQDSERSRLWEFQASDVQKLIEFSKKENAVQDPFAAFLAFEFLQFHKKKVIALNLLRRASVKHPRNFQISWKLAVLYRYRATYYRRFNPQDASRTALYFYQCAANHPRHQTAQLKCSRWLAEIGDVDGAILVLLQAAKNWPEDSRVFSSLAERYLSNGNYETAREYAEKACKIATRNVLRKNKNPNQATPRSDEDSAGVGYRDKLMMLAENTRAEVADLIQNERLAYKTMASVLIEQGEHKVAEILIDCLITDSQSCEVGLARILASNARKKGDIKTEIEWLDYALRNCRVPRNRREIRWEIDFANLRLRYCSPEGN